MEDTTDKEEHTQKAGNDTQSPEEAASKRRDITEKQNNGEHQAAGNMSDNTKDQQPIIFQNEHKEAEN